MSSNQKNKMRNKKEDGKFSSKNVKHEPQAESARAVFGLDGKGRPDKER